MIAILKKEINSFFATPVGYLVIGVFLVLNGLLLWVFKGEYNIIDGGFADLNGFFFLAPWIMLFLIPAITMKSFSDEKRLGTLELLFTKPISHIQLVAGKFTAALVLCCLALLPTFLYVYTIHQLGNPIGNLDTGSIIGSYIALMLLIAAYSAIGTFTSTLSDNQIVAFIYAVALSFFMYYGFEAIANLELLNGNLYWISALGFKIHFDSISRGVLDSRDMLYFVSVAYFFLYLTVFQLKKLHQ